MRTLFAVIYSCFLFFTGYAQDVGIGTNTPLMQLHVAENGRNVLLIENTQSLNTNVKTAFYFKTGNGSKPYTGAIMTIGEGTTAARLGLFTRASSLPNGLLERLTILNNGNIGINITNPPVNLAVLGNADFSGSVAVGTNTPAASAMMELNSTTKGFLPPRMTASQRAAIASPAAGLLVYQTTVPSGFYYYTGTDWVSIEGAGSGANSSAACIDYDGNAYPTITINNQVWMAENLRVTHYRNGDIIPNVSDGTEWTNLSSGAYCWYDNNMTSNEKYGVLYNWHTVDDSRGLCPAGWHVPTDAEWTELTNYLDGANYAGGKMKSLSALWTSPNTDATNTSGFSGLPGGYRTYDGVFGNLNLKGFWWSSSEQPVDRAWYRYLYYLDPEVRRLDYEINFGFNVRCLRDN